MIQFIETDLDGLMVAVYEIEIPAEVPMPSVEGNLIVTNPGERIVGWPAQGHQTAYFADGTLSLMDVRTLAEAKAAKNAEINAARLAANRASFTFGGKAIACDELSALDIASMNGIVALIGAMPPGWPGAWKAMDNTYVSIPDRATWIVFYGAMVQAGQSNFSHAQTLKAALAAATTNAEIDSITWE